MIKIIKRNKERTRGEEGQEGMAEVCSRTCGGRRGWAGLCGGHGDEDEGNKEAVTHSVSLLKTRGGKGSDSCTLL